ncbi:DUF7528 family protein [Halospeciosus flavus]|uniref:Uncharacterized protein n=1 Tax=Halospeciosus flavus TaxID=3032283 RepID=A0ABD5Z998_9EURY
MGAKSAGSNQTPTADATGDAVLLELDGAVHELTRAEAAALRETLDDTLTGREEFLRTAGVHREDGSYVVERRGADSAGHRKVFECFDALRRLYDRLPATFTADDLSATGLTGGRRHMVLRHFVEHPAFDCTLSKRQPLTARKEGVDRSER